MVKPAGGSKGRRQRSRNWPGVWQLHTQVDRSSRRDLSLFRIAWDSLQRALLLALPFTVFFEPSFGPLPNFHPCGC